MSLHPVARSVKLLLVFGSTVIRGFSLLEIHDEEFCSLLLLGFQFQIRRQVNLADGNIGFPQPRQSKCRYSTVEQTIVNPFNNSSILYYKISLSIVASEWVVFLCRDTVHIGTLLKISQFFQSFTGVVLRLVHDHFLPSTQPFSAIESTYWHRNFNIRNIIYFKYTDICGRAEKVNKGLRIINSNQDK